jgi:hypothetical protein
MQYFEGQKFIHAYIKDVLTVVRYSTARSGLLKLALNALITCSRSKPISIMRSIVVCNTLPETKELVSPKAGGAASGWRWAAGAAVEGAAGTSGVEVAGTAGAAGTAEEAGAGSAGAGLLVVAGVLVDAAGDALGYSTSTNQSLDPILSSNK